MRRIFATRMLSGRFPAGKHSVIKLVTATVLITIASVANAVTVVLVSQNQTSGSGVIGTLVTDGSSSLNPGSFPVAYGGLPGATTATYDWDGTMLTSIGIHAVASHIGSSPFNGAILADVIQDLSIDTSANGGLGQATATAYQCNSGSFLLGVSLNVCGGYDFGPNSTDESVATWTGILVNLDLNVNPTSFFPAFVSTVQDDFLSGGQRTISTYDYGTVSVTGTGQSPGDLVMIGNGVALGTPADPIAGTPAGELMIFQVQTSAVDDSVDARPGVLVSIPVLANDALTDNIAALTTSNFSSGGAAGVVGVPGPQAGVTVEYTSAPAFVGVETFDYTVTDADGTPVGATVTVTVTDQVVANDDGAQAAAFATIKAGEMVSLDVLANDVGLSDTPLTVVSPFVDFPALGTVAVTGSVDASSIRIEYTAGPTPGTDFFGYQVSDNSAKMGNATVFVEILPQSIPVAVDDAATTSAGKSVSVNVLTNDTGLDDIPLTVTITTAPANGSIGTILGCTAQATCDVPYVPDAGFAGSDTFQYRVTDSTGDDSNNATVTVTVNEVPIAVDDTASTSGTNAVTINVLANDSGLSFMPLTVAAAGNAAFAGTAVAQADNTVLYVPPAAGVATTDVFDYTVTDANGNSASARVTVSIVPTQDTLPGNSSAMGPAGLGLLVLLSWMRRRKTG